MEDLPSTPETNDDIPFIKPADVGTDSTPQDSIERERGLFSCATAETRQVETAKKKEIIKVMEQFGMGLEPLENKPETNVQTGIYI